MKTILLLVRDDAGLQSRLMAAFDLVTALEAKLVCLDLVEPEVVADGLGGLHPVVTDRQRLREISLRARIDDSIREHGIQAEWIEAIGDAGTCLIDAAALSDLVVMGRDYKGGLLPFFPGLSSEVIVKSGRPVLVMPDRIDGIDLKGDALVAWDGSRSCIAAMRAALPLLAIARSITFFEIDDGSVAIPAERATDYLASYAIVSHVAPKHALITTAGHILGEECRRRRPSYVVMGGYGHSRAREAIFGGVTRTMLEHCRRPLFLAHG